MGVIFNPAMSLKLDTMIKRGERNNGATIMERLAYQRYMRGINVKDIAKRIGINRVSLSSYELGKANVPFFVVEALCDVFEFKLTIQDKKGNKIYEN